jgi:catechol 2,3-dioxygenase-like lactoylglutathione lyase family enzyme
VPDLERALDLFTRVLRFEVPYRLGEYAYVKREGAAIRILEERGRRLDLDKKARVTVYIDVSDVDALYSELQSGLSTLPEGDVEPPNDQSWGQREFQVRLPDGQWLTFGQPGAKRE